MVKPKKTYYQLGIITGVLLVIAVVSLISALRQSTPADELPKPINSEEVLPVQETLESEQTATYTVEYDVPWSIETHPQTLPAGAHVSPIVIVSHMNKNDLFASDTSATDGIEVMAETGATEILLAEISANTSILNSVTGTRIDAPGTNALEIKLDQDYSRLSAVSMLAPSPDWFVAINGLELFSEGRWVEMVVLELRPYDAGTDSGATFTANDADTVPPAVIGPPVDDEFKAAVAENDLATLTITRQR